jgi:hypothetical protein
MLKTSDSRRQRKILKVDQLERESEHREVTDRIASKEVLDCRST